jgi:hypothetical protein
LLFTILLLQTGGILLIYKLKQSYVQYQMSLSLKSNETTFEKIIITTGDYKKSRIKSNEISYKGKMYDVKSINIFYDKVELLVINDRDEENILEAINNFVSKTNRPDIELSNQLKILFSLNYLSPDTEHIFFIPSFCIHIFHQPNLNIAFTDSDVYTPPPRFA